MVSESHEAPLDGGHGRIGPVREDEIVGFAHRAFSSLGAGSRSGAAILSEHMIAYGNEGHTPHAGAVALVDGPGDWWLSSRPDASDTEADSESTETTES